MNSNHNNKKLLKELVSHYNNKYIDRVPEYSNENTVIISRLITAGLLKKDPFIFKNMMQSDEKGNHINVPKCFYDISDYPLTEKGKNFLEKNWLERWRASNYLHPKIQPV